MKCIKCGSPGVHRLNDGSHEITCSNVKCDQSTGKHFLREFAEDGWVKINSEVTAIDLESGSQYEALRQFAARLAADRSTELYEEFQKHMVGVINAETKGIEMDYETKCTACGADADIESLEGEGEEFCVHCEGCRRATAWHNKEADARTEWQWLQRYSPEAVAWLDCQTDKVSAECVAEISGEVPDGYYLGSILVGKLEDFPDTVEIMIRERKPAPLTGEEWVDSLPDGTTWESDCDLYAKIGGSAVVAHTGHSVIYPSSANNWSESTCEEITRPRGA